MYFCYLLWNQQAFQSCTEMCLLFFGGFQVVFFPFSLTLVHRMLNMVYLGMVLLMFILLESCSDSCMRKYIFSSTFERFLLVFLLIWQRSNFTLFFFWGTITWMLDHLIFISNFPRGCSFIFNLLSLFFRLNNFYIYILIVYI